MESKPHTINYYLKLFKKTNLPNHHFFQIIAILRNLSIENVHKKYALNEIKLSKDKEDIILKIINNKYKNWQYIVNECFFYGYKYYIEKPVFIPRIETEILVTKSLKHIKDIKKPNIIEFGTGSGAIISTIQKEKPDANTFGIELDKIAIKCSKKNAPTTTIICNDWIKNFSLNKKFDLIISNPPYIEKEIDEEDIYNIDQSNLAKYGNQSIEDYYIDLVRFASKFLNQKGKLIIEKSKTLSQDIIEKMKEINVFEINKQQVNVAIVRKFEIKYINDNLIILVRK